MTTPGFRDDGFYLALDTSGPVGYVAVSQGADVLARARMERQGKHAARIIPTVDAVLTDAGLEIGELAGIVVGEGPGSFTGVRVAASTAKGLARALDVPLWALSSLAAAAVGDLGAGGPGVRYVLFDARADRVYAACYGVGSRGVEGVGEAAGAGGIGETRDNGAPGPGRASPWRRRRASPSTRYAVSSSSISARVRTASPTSGASGCSASSVERIVVRSSTSRSRSLSEISTA